MTGTADANAIWEAIVSVYQERGMEEYLPLLKEFLLSNEHYNGKITNWLGID